MIRTIGPGPFGQLGDDSGDLGVRVEGRHRRLALGSLVRRLVDRLADSKPELLSVPLVALDRDEGDADARR